MGISLVKCTMTKLGRLELSCGHPTQESCLWGKSSIKGVRRAIWGGEKKELMDLKMQVNPKSEEQTEETPTLAFPKNLYICSTGCLFHREHLHSRDGTAQVK